MLKKVLVVYYTQTGQLKDIVNSVMSPMADDKEIELYFEELKPDPQFPFPWTSDEFFQAMPESVKGIPCKLKPLSIKGDENFDLVIIAWQPWYLSPSIPIHAFFQNEMAVQIISGKPVIMLTGCRNMWLMAFQRIKDYLNMHGAKLAGNIVLFDRSPNLLSVFSIIRWMFKGKKDRCYGIIPPAGVSEKDIQHASVYGHIIHAALKEDRIENVGKELVQSGSVEVKTGVIMMEKRAIKFFRIWADFILRKGSYGQKSRVPRIRLFKYYLLLVIYLVSPFASLVYEILKPFRTRTIKKQISLYQSL